MRKPPHCGGFCVSCMDEYRQQRYFRAWRHGQHLRQWMRTSLFMKTCRLRKFRKFAHLTQREVAMLVGYASQRAYSDLELGLKRPALGTVLACCILFDASVCELFPELAEFVARDVLARARKLNEAIEADRTREATASYMAAVVERIGGSSTLE